MAQAMALSEQDGNRLAELAGELERDQPMLDAARTESDGAAKALQDAEAAMLAWQTNWDSFNQGANEPAQQAQVERTRLNHLEQQEVQLKRRLTRNDEERGHLADVSLAAEIADLQRRESEGEAALIAFRGRVEARVQSIATLRQLGRVRLLRVYASRAACAAPAASAGATLPASLQFFLKAAFWVGSSRRAMWRRLMPLRWASSASAKQTSGIDRLTATLVRSSPQPPPQHEFSNM